MNQNQTQKEINLGESIIEWDTPEFIKYHTGKIWKISAILIVVLFVVLSILMQSLTFSLVILAFAFTYYILFNRNPELLRIYICENGIRIGGRKIPYEKISAFWLIENPPVMQTITFRLKGKLFGDMTFLRTNISPDLIRQILKNKITEIPIQKESLLDIIFKYLRF